MGSPAQTSKLAINTSDVLLVRSLLARLTAGQRPLSRTVEWVCPHCKGVYSAGGLRVHVPRCESNPKTMRRTYAETVLGASRLSPAAHYQEYGRMEWLNTGKQGAD